MARPLTSGLANRIVHGLHFVTNKTRQVWWQLRFDMQIGASCKFGDLRFINTTDGAIRIGKNCRINSIALAGPIDIGDNVLLNLQSDVSGRGYHVVIGNNVLVGPRVSILASMHNYRDKTRLIREQGTSGGDVIIEDDAWIGTGAVILPGVRIGCGAVVGANAVVTHSIPAYAVAVGSPARVIDYRE